MITIYKRGICALWEGTGILITKKVNSINFHRQHFSRLYNYYVNTVISTFQELKPYKSFLVYLLLQELENEKYWTLTAIKIMWAPKSVRFCTKYIHNYAAGDALTDKETNNQV